MLPLGAIIAAVAAVLCVWYVTAMPGRSYRGSLRHLTVPEAEVADRVRHHVRVLALDIGERHVWKRSALDVAAQYVEEQLRASGYAMSEQAYQVYGVPVRNVEAERPGDTHPEEIVLIGAHYDSLVGTPGANDNASGVAAMLELARLCAGEPLHRTVRFVGFVNEEPPFSFTSEMGSRVYARRSRARRERIVAMLSLETVGYYSDEAGSQRYPFPLGFFYPRVGNFIGFVGNMSSRSLVRRCVGSFRRHALFPSEGVAAPGYLPGVFWSDHWAFWREGYRAVMVTDTAPFRYPHYHSVDDTTAMIHYERLARVVVSLRGVVADLTASSQGARHA